MCENIFKRLSVTQEMQLTGYTSVEQGERVVDPMTSDPW